MTRSVRVLIFGGVFYLYYMYLGEHLPPGHYLLILFWLPVAIACPIFFFLVAWFLERCGVRIYKRSARRGPGESENPNERSSD